MSEDKKDAPVTLDSLWAQYLAENRAGLDTSGAMRKGRANGAARP